jgi:hypothetical protein
MLQLGAVKMPSKLEITGEGGTVFNWYSPQNGMELRHPVKLLALAMRDKLPFTTPSDDFYDSIQSVYEMIWRFRENTGDDLSDFNTATRYDWDSLGTAIGEDLTFFKDMVFDDISYVQTGTIFQKNLLTTMYKIVEEMSLYRARFGELPMDSASEEWVNYAYVDPNNPTNSELFCRFKNNPLEGGDTNQNTGYNKILSYINDDNNYTNSNDYDFSTNPVTEPLKYSLTPRRVGAYYFTRKNSFSGDYFFNLFGRQFQQNYPSLAKSFNFGYRGRRSDGFVDMSSAGEFNSIYPDENTEYYQYVYSTKNGTGYTATNFFDFGGGFLENKISHIQQAYSADGYILRTDPLTMDFSTIPNEVPASYGCQIRTILTFNINHPRFTDYYTE